MDWTTAKDTCEALAPGAELASIRDREENSFVKGKYKKNIIIVSYTKKSINYFTLNGLL